MSDPALKDAIWFGQRQIPTTRQGFFALLGEHLAAPNQQLPASLEQALTADFGDFPTIRQIAGDLSGQDLPINNQSEKAPRDATVVGEHQGRLDQVHLQGAPMLVDGTPVRFQVALRGVSLDWLQDDRGGLWAALGRRRQPDFAGEFAFRFNLDDAVALVRRQLEQQASGSSGLRELTAQVAVEPPANGQQHITAQAVMVARFGILGARLRGHTEVELTNRTGEIRVEDVSVRTRNPIYALTLFALRGRIRSVVGRTYSVAQLTRIDGAQAADVHVEQRGSELSVQGRLV